MQFYLRNQIPQNNDNEWLEGHEEESSLQKIKPWQNWYENEFHPFFIQNP